MRLPPTTSLTNFPTTEQETLRGFGVDERVVRLPASPLADPDSPLGLDVLMNCYIERMEGKVSSWYENILVVDLKVSVCTGHSAQHAPLRV